MDRQPLPIGAQLRKRNLKDSKDTDSTNGQKTEVKVSSIDEEIARLEAELMNSDVDGESDEESDESSSNRSDNASVEMIDGLVAIKSDSGEILALKSSLEAERITSLPKHLLPQPNCSKADKSKTAPFSRVRFNSSIDGGSSDRKRVRISELSDNLKGHKVEPSHQQRPSGLSKTVQELIRSYVPASHDKKAFYCRCCQFHGSSEDDFFAHRETSAHKEATELERKASYCRLCRKQFTSPEQIKEHLKGKSHKLKLDATSRNNSRGNMTASGVKLSRI